MARAAFAAVVISICLAGSAKAQPGGKAPLTTARTSGVITVGGTIYPYLVEGRGLDCIVVGPAPGYAQLFSESLKQHIRFIYVDFKKTWAADVLHDPEKISMDTLVQEIDEVRRALGLGRICVVGHSTPGLLALEFAARHPDQTSRVILVNVPPFLNRDFAKARSAFWEADASPERKAIQQQNIRRMPDSILTSLSPRDAFALRYVRSGPKYFFDASYDFYWAWSGRQFSAELITRFINVIAADYNPWSRLSTNTVPIFVALGRYDYVVPYREWNSVKDRIPHLTCELFDRSAHFTMLEAAPLFDDRLIRWLDSSP